MKKRILTTIVSMVVAVNTCLASFVSMPIEAHAADSWNFGYTGSVQEFTAPSSGKYYIEMYGASGGGASHDSSFNGTWTNGNGGFGGKTTGYINLKAGQKLYIQVGQAGSINGGNTYNGGGQHGGSNSGSGGGATSITTTNRGVLSSYKNYQSEVVAVAGGGGGRYALTDHHHRVTGSGGGLQGADNNSSYGGKQTTGYAFGQGGPGSAGGGGGGGYYGGSGSSKGQHGGAGGSGYVGGIYNAKTEFSQYTGNGSVTIKYEGSVNTSLIMNLGDGFSYNGQNGNVVVTGEFGSTKNIKITTATGYKFYNWIVNKGDFNASNGLTFNYTFGASDTEITAKYQAPLTLTASTESLESKGYLILSYEENDNLDKDIIVYEKSDDGDWVDVVSTSTSSGGDYNKTFVYTGGVQTFTAKLSGTYHIEAKGAQGGTGGTGCAGGKGAIVSADVFIRAGQTVYIYVGGSNGYNGGGSVSNGGSGSSYGGAGGGASTVSLTSTMLQNSNITDASKNMLVVAGGGGGAGGGGSRGGSYYTNGYGGASGKVGSSGNIGNGGETETTQPCMTGHPGGGATQSSAGGGGATGTHHSHSADDYHSCGSGGGGGGGWYGGGGGGGGYTDYASSSDCYGNAGSNGSFGKGGSGGAGGSRGYNWHTGSGAGGGGGSSWITPSADNPSYSTGNTGNGSLTISLNKIGDDLGEGKIAVYAKDVSAPNATSNGHMTSNSSGAAVEWDLVDDNGDLYQFKAASFLTENGNKIQETQVLSTYALSGLKGFYYYLDNSASGTATSSNDFVYNNYANLTDNQIISYRYIHIAPVDYAGNVGATYTYNIPLGVSISFDKNDTAKNINGDTCTSNATGSTSSQIVLYGKTENLNANGFSKVGYTFSNWNTKSNNSGTSFTNKQSVAYNWLVANLGYTVKLYAIWKPIEYDIVYNKNKPSKASSEVQGEMNSHHIYDKPQNLAKNTYTLTGWRFNGWNTQADGKGTAYADGASVKNLTTTNGGKVTLYAQWVQNTYTVNIYQNKPSNASHDIARLVTPSGYTWSTDHWTKTFTYDDTTIGYTPTQLFSLKGWTIDKVNYYSKADGTGTKYTSSSRNLTATHNGTVNIYVKWTANKYNIYYEKGLTSDTSTTTIANANVNTNIQKTGTDRPYTIATYDSPVKFATIASLNGRKYTLTFDSNKPSSISKQNSNKTAVPTNISTITGNLTSKDIWQISEQDSDVKTNLTPTMGSEVSKPNYKDADGKYATATALWNNTKLNNFGSPTLDGWKFVGWYTKKTGENSEAVSNTTDMIRVVNSSKNVSPNNKVDTRYNVTEFTVQPKTTEFNQTLYARWQRTITLTFNMNGGQYKGDSSNVVLTGIYYTNANGYNFSLSDTPTAASLPNYEKQINQIDAYGTYDANGENSKYTKYDETTGVTYRFLGWSTNKNATEPDSKYIVYSSSKAQTLRLYDNTTLYAVWEPVLIASISVQRTLGDLTFSDGTKPINSVKSKRDSDDFNYLGIIIKPGEQASYTIQSYGKSDRVAIIGFDPKIEDIYSNVGLWTDNLNPNTGTGEEIREYCGLSRQINSVGSQITRKFYIPQYLGTEQSYISSIGVKQYTLGIAIGQESFYKKYVYGHDEVVAAFVTIYITDDKAPIIDPINPTPTDPIPTDPVEPSEPVISVLDELRSRLKIRLH